MITLDLATKLVSNLCFVLVKQSKNHLQSTRRTRYFLPDRQGAMPTVDDLVLEPLRFAMAPLYEDRNDLIVLNTDLSVNGADLSEFKDFTNVRLNAGIARSTNPAVPLVDQFAANNRQTV